MAFISGLTGPVLPAVRGDHRHLHGDLGHQLADPVTGAGRQLLKATTTPKDALTRVMDKAVGLASSARSTASSTAARTPTAVGVRVAGAGVAGDPGLWCCYRGPVQGRAGGFMPAQDKQYLIAACPAARWRHAGPHRGRDQAHGEDRQEHDGVEDAWPSRACRSTASPTAPTAASCSSRSSPSPSAPALTSAGRGHRAEPGVRQHPGGVHRHVPAAARGRAWAPPVGLQAVDRGPRLAWATRAQDAREGLHGQGLPDAGAGLACSAATRSTCRSWTPRSTAARPRPRVCR